MLSRIFQLLLVACVVTSSLTVKDPQQPAAFKSSAQAPAKLSGLWRTEGYGYLIQLERLTRSRRSR